MWQISYAVRETVEAVLAFFRRHTNAFRGFTRALFGLFLLSELAGHLVPTAQRRKRDRLIRRCQYRHAPRKAHEIAMRLQDTPEKRMIGVDLDSLFFFARDLAFLIEGLQHARHRRACTAQKEYLDRKSTRLKSS